MPKRSYIETPQVHATDIHVRDESRRLLAILFFLYIFSFLDRQIIALLVEPIKRDLLVTDFQFSLLHGLAFTIFYTAFGFPLGWAADRFSRRKLIYWGATIWGVMTMLCGFTSQFAHLFAARVGVGVGEASLSPAAYSMLGDSVPEDKLPRAMNIYASGSIVGAGFALLTGGFLIGLMAEESLINVPLIGAMRPWQVVFLICGAPSIFVAFLMFTVREPVRKGTLATNRDKLSISDTFRFIYSRKRLFVCHFMGFGFLSIVGQIFAAWGPTYMIRVHSYTAQSVGIIFGLMLLVIGPLSALLVGEMIRRMEKSGMSAAPLTIYSIASVLTMIASLVAYLSASDIACLLAMGLIVLFIFLFTGPAILVLKNIAPNEMRGQMTALFILTVGVIGMGLGPMIVALITDFYFQSDASIGKSLAVVSSLSAGGASVFLWKGRTPYMEARMALKAMTD